MHTTLPYRRIRTLEEQASALMQLLMEFAALLIILRKFFRA
jgi:hypothetical protein